MNRITDACENITVADGKRLVKMVNSCNMVRGLIVGWKGGGEVFRNGTSVFLCLCGSVSNKPCDLDSTLT